jgi:hypothetical protein
MRAYSHTPSSHAAYIKARNIYGTFLSAFPRYLTRFHSLGTMMHFKTLPLVAALVGCVVSVPLSTPSPIQEIEGISIGDIINALGVGLVTNIGVVIPVRRGHLF